MSRQRDARRHRRQQAKSLYSHGIADLAPRLPSNRDCSCSRSLRLGHPGREAGPQSQGSPRETAWPSKGLMPAAAGSPSCSRRSLVMARLRFAAALIAVLALAACTDSDSLTAPSGTRSRRQRCRAVQSGGGDTAATSVATPPRPTLATRRRPTRPTRPARATRSPTAPGPTPTAPRSSRWIPGVYDPTESGTAGTTRQQHGAASSRPAGSGLYGVGTCGPNGMWTDPAGNVFGPNNPNCLDYGSDGTRQQRQGAVHHVAQRPARPLGQSRRPRRRTRSTPSAPAPASRRPRWR